MQLPPVFRGTNQTASDESLLTALGVTALLSTSTVDHEVPQDVLQYLQCSFNDLNTSLSLQRQKAMDTISSTRQMAGRVLVFDNEDLNCCVCMMYLMWECRLTLLQSFALVQYKLPTLRVSRRLCVRHSRNPRRPPTLHDPHLWPSDPLSLLESLPNYSRAEIPGAL